ncbi:SusC/RagA family TonB-linked outer membrane protein [Pedobacter sp. KBW06]|uniref:SusC/RagA family TonB-linked outer membrane protein n=1 Tax=Pedobacter sp. KBW06 TaxID=2153359 RepID=UPI0013157182|nr:SusC/RagA family TonB-linked outer membrane protein [Pedobacter sp. KBW06]
MIIALMQVSASGLAQKVSLNFENATLTQVLVSLKRQTGYNFVYTEDIIRKAKPISVRLKNIDLEEALKICFKNQPLVFTIESGTIVIMDKPLLNRPEKRAEILTDQYLRCVVHDEAGLPLAGATVRVKGTSKMTYTDNRGMFTLQKVAIKDTLLLSYLGYKTMTIPVRGLHNGSIIKMETATETLDELKVMINTGYQRITKDKATGAFDHLDNKTLERASGADILSRIGNISNGLVFNDPNADRLAPNNDTRGRQSIRIRGQSSFTSTLVPLIILDNFPYEGDIYNLNPNDIESVTILKDAAAAAIWGARAGNGVLVITSKKGVYNQTTNVSAGANIMIGQKPNLFYAPNVSSTEYIQLERDQFDKGLFDDAINSLRPVPLTPAVQALADHKQGKLTDQELEKKLAALSSSDIREDLSRYLFQKSINQQYHIKVSGGGDQQKYYLSAGYDKAINSIKGNQSDRLTLNADHSYKFFHQFLELNTGLRYTRNQIQSGPSYPSINYPYAHLKEEDGTNATFYPYRKSFLDKWEGKLLDWTYRPLDEFKLQNNKSTSTDYQFKLDAKFNFSKSLNVNFTALLATGNELSQKDRDVNSFFSRDLINNFSQVDPLTGSIKRIVPYGGILASNNSEYQNKNYRTQLNYNNNWGQNHQLSFLAGAELRQTDRESRSDVLYGYDAAHRISTAVDLVNYYPNLTNRNFTQIPYQATSTSLSDRNISVFSTANYTFYNRYTLSASARTDAANILGVKTNQKWIPLWSVGLNWNIGKEAFYSLSWLPNLKLRSSFGYMGNVRTDITAHLVMNTATDPLFNIPKAVIKTPPNPDLHWERVGIFNIGADFSTKDGVLSGSLDYYSKNITDLISARELAPAFGLSMHDISLLSNIGKMKGQGWDLQLRSENLKGRFSWKTTLNLSRNTNQVTEYSFPIRYNEGYISGELEVGKPLNKLYSYKWAGLDPQTGDPRGYLNGQISSDYYSIVYGTDPNSVVYHGSDIPTTTTNLMNTFNWKQFDLSVNLSGKFGYYFRRNSISYTMYPGLVEQKHSDLSLRWQKPGDEKWTNVPSMFFLDDYERQLFYDGSETLVEKGDHIRLQDMRLGYTFSMADLPRLPFRGIQMYLYLTNLGLLWSANKKNIDPDNIPSPGVPGTVAARKTISFGLKLNL